jgi:hypothetical protein
VAGYYREEIRSELYFRMRGLGYKLRKCAVGYYKEVVNIEKATIEMYDCIHLDGGLEALNVIETSVKRTL